MRNDRMLAAVLAAVVGLGMMPAVASAAPKAKATTASAAAAATAAQAAESADTSTESGTDSAPIATPTPKPAPVLVIASYDTSKERLLIGSSFKLTIDIRNATPRRAQNVVVSLGTEGASAAAAGGGTGTGGLTVLGTGNAKYVGTLGGKSRGSVTFKVVAGPGTPPGATTIPVTIRFEHDGERFEETHSIGLVFERDAVLKVATAEIPQTVQVGEKFDASFELANSGGFAVSGLSISVEATPAAVTDGSVFIGAFEAATTEAIDVSITAEKPGSLPVRLVATYRDDLGREKTFESEYTVDVQGEPEPAEGPGSDAGQPEEEGNWFVRFFRALFGLGS